MKTITYNPETHVLVPREPSGVMQAAMEAQWEAGAYVDMAKREWGAAIAAAPQPEPVEGDPVGYINIANIQHLERGFLQSNVRIKRKHEPQTVPLYTAPQPARVAELEAALKMASSAITRLIEVTPSSLGQCSGLKCREPYCISCYEEADAEVYLQSVYDLCHEAQGVVTRINEVIGE